MEMVNGYVFLDLTKSNVYSKALKVLGTDKPVVIKDGSGSPYFVDSLTLDGTNVVITKGGKTITIANDNTITNVGDIQNHLYEYDIKLQCTTTAYYFKKILNTNNYNGVIDINATLFSYLEDLNCFFKQVAEQDNDERPCIIYDIEDVENFQIAIRDYDGTSSTDTIEKVDFTLIQKLF